MNEHILVEDRGAVRVLTLNRPDKRNAFNNRMYLELATELERAQADAGVHLVVLAANGEMFTAGQDLSEMNAMATTDEPIGFSRLFVALEGLAKPLLGAITGSGVGLGFTLLLHLDVTYVADDARFRLPFVPMGVVPEAASSFLLPQRIGQAAAAEILYSGRWVGADELAQRGVVSRTMPREQVLEATLALAAQLADQPQAGLLATRRLLRQHDADAVRAALAAEARAFAAILGSPESVAAIQAYFARARGSGAAR